MVGDPDSPEVAVRGGAGLLRDDVGVDPVPERLRAAFAGTAGSLNPVVL
jgi:hypothetical protein